MSAALVFLAWLALFAWLWIGTAVPAPAGAAWLLQPRIVGLLWFIAGACWARAYWLTLGIALAWFGNNPGGEHQLALLEMGLMGLNARYWFDRARGHFQPQPRRGDGWLAWFVAYSLLTVLPQWRLIWCEIDFAPRTALATIMNHYGTAPVFGGQMGLKLALAWGLYLDLRDRPWRWPALLRQWRVMLIMLLISAVIGLLQYDNLISLAWWRGENPDVVSFGFRRLQSLYWHSGWYAQYLAGLAPAALAWAWLARTRAPRWGWWLAALMLALTMLLTMQRAGWLALAAGYGFVALYAGRSKPREAHKHLLPSRLRNALLAVGMLVLLGVVLAWVLPSFRHRAAQLATYEHRTSIWQATVKIIARYPLTGAGFGNYYTTHTRVFNWDHPYYQMHDKVGAHNLWLHMTAERGVIGVLLFSVFLVFLLRRVARALKAAETERRWLWLALGGGLCALCVNGLFQEVFYVRTVELLFWLLAGWTTLAPEPPVTAPLLSRRLRIFWSLAALAAGTAAIVHAQWTWIGPFYWYFKDFTYTVAGREIRVHLAGDAPQAFTVACMSPDVSVSRPVIFTLRYNNKPLPPFKFTAEDWQTFIVDPQGVSGELKITASRVWSPMAQGNRVFPVTEVGVLYFGPFPPASIFDSERRRGPIPVLK